MCAVISPQMLMPFLPPLVRASPPPLPALVLISRTTTHFYNHPLPPTTHHSYIFSYPSQHYYLNMAEQSPLPGTTAAALTHASNAVSALYSQSNANDVTAVNNYPALVDCFSDSSSSDNEPLERLSSDDEDSSDSQSARPTAAEMLGPACYATAMAMPMADGRTVMELLETLHPENRLRALEMFDHYCAMGARLLARHEQIQRASDARSAATAAMAAAAAEAALAAQAKALLELEADRCNQTTGRGLLCSRLWRSCPFVKHAAARHAAGLPCAAPVPCEKHWRYRQESCDKCYRRRRLRLLGSLLQPLK